MLKISILDRLIKNGLRCFKGEIFVNQVNHFQQYHSGNEDFLPGSNCRAMGAFFNNNPANGVIFGYQDDVPRVSLAGEKRIYAVDGDNNVVVEIYLQNTGMLNITANTICNINTETVNVNASQVNLGSGGQKIARLGDQVTVNGQVGYITSAGVNTSI